jgi:hypothetical protein
VWGKILEVWIAPSVGRILPLEKTPSKGVISETAFNRVKTRKKEIIIHK